MSEALSPEEVAVMIRARQIEKEKGLAKKADVSSICKAAGISRKTGYQWAQKYSPDAFHTQKEHKEQISNLEAERKRLEKELDDVRFENEGRKLAWEIHRVDELLAEKKTRTTRGKRKSGEFFTGSKPGNPANRMDIGLKIQHAFRLEQRI